MSSNETASIRLDLEGHIFESIENWRRSHPKIPSRAEAVRQLVEQALAACPVVPSVPGLRT
jgi:hypothetical protein